MPPLASSRSRINDALVSSYLSWVFVLISPCLAACQVPQPPSGTGDGGSRISPDARLQIRWLGGGKLWYTVPNRRGEMEYVWVAAHQKTTERAASLSELENLIGFSLSGSQGLHRIEPSENREGSRIGVEIRNETSFPVELYWVDFQGRPQSYGTLEAGSSRTQSTFPGHAWVATNSDRRPIWTAKPNVGGEVLAIHEMDLEESALFQRGGLERRRGMRRRNASKTPASVDGNDALWKVERIDYNLHFHQASGSVFDTSSIAECRGSEDLRYDSEIHWSPDGRYAFTLQNRQGEHREVTLVESSPRDQLQPRRIPVRYDKPGDRLDQPVPRLFDLETQRPIPIDLAILPDPWSIEDVRWSEDSSRVTCVYNQRGHQVLRMIAIDPKTGSVTSLIEESSGTYVDYAAKAFREVLEDSQEVIWGSERDGWYHLYLFDLQSGELVNQMTRGPWVVREVEHIDRDARQVWFYAGGVLPNQDPYYRHLCRVNFDGSGLVVLTAGDGDHRCEWSPDREWLVDTYSRVDMPPIHELRSAITGELILELERSSDEGLWTSTNRPERFVAKGRDGVTDIYGLIIRPKELEIDKRYPVIEEIYAGPQDSFVPKAYSPLREYHALADQGYIVVKIDGMGTSNRSKAFQDVSYRNLSDGGFPDRIQWIRSAAMRYLELDIERVGIYGGSAGGQNALAAMLFHGSFYDAAVADCGCHDNRMDKVWWNELYMGWPIGKQYTANSNVVHAHRLTGQLLLIVGELDTNVDPASTMQVVDALVKADKDFDLLVIPGGGHGAGSSPYGKRRRDAFFREHLKSASPPRRQTATPDPIDAPP